MFPCKVENLLYATRFISRVNIPTSNMKPKAANAMNKMAGIECVVQGRTARESNLIPYNCAIIAAKVKPNINTNQTTRPAPNSGPSDGW